MTANTHEDRGEAPAARESGAAPGGDGSDRDAFDELRRLLIGSELSRVDNLAARLDDPARYAEDVSRILPDAVGLSAARDDRLGTALRPSIEDAVRVSVRRDAKVLVDALFPVMGPAIRKAVAAAIGDLVQTLNRTLEHSFSLQGIRWRIEALRTGRPFAEVVLLHSLVFRVEQVLLIHTETGLLLQHVVAPSIEAPDGDLVSSMLTAIQDFARDSFSAGREDALEAVRLGELNMWVERGPHATIAGVIRGTAPAELRRLFVDALEAIHLEHAEALATFSGDASEFDSCRPVLESCLDARFESEESRPSPALVAIAGAAVVVLLLWAGYQLWQQSKWNGYLAALRAEPGIVVVETGAGGGMWKLSGLRDPEAADPATLLAAAGLDPEDVEAKWEPYHSFAPEFLAARARAILAPPDTVRLAVDGSRVRVEGEARHEWIVASRRLVRAIPGLQGLDESALVDLDRRELNELARALEARVVLFVTNTAQVVPGQEAEIDAVARALGTISDMGKRQGVPVAVEAIGHTDSTGSETTNSPLSAERAERLVALLAARGADMSNLRARGVATSSPVRNEATPEDAAFNRSVTFEVTLGE